MKSVIYCRVSTKEQEETGYSLTAQESLLREYATANDITVTKAFTISESASGKIQRRTFGEMLEYLNKQKISSIICEKTDRLTRNLKDAVLINEWINKDSDRKVHFVKENFILTKDSKSNEKFIWNIKVSVAQYYTDNLSEEVKKGQNEKIKQGWYPTRPPLGYRSAGEKGHRIHLIDDKKAQYIRKCFKLYGTGLYSIQKVADIMSKDNFYTLEGKPVTKRKINEILTNPYYCGKIRWNESIFQGKQEPIVDEKLFNTVQRLLKSKTTPKYNKHNFLYKGLIRCKECGGLITWETQKGINYGHCNHYKDCSQKIWVKETDITERITENIGKFRIANLGLANWVLKALKESHKEEIGYYQNQKEQLNNKLTMIENRLEKIYEDHLDGRITGDFYDKKFNEYSGEKEKVLKKLETEGKSNIKYYQLASEIFELSQKSQKVYPKFSKEDKRKMINSIFSELYVLDGELQYQYTHAFHTLLKAVEATNSSKVTELFEKHKENFEPSFIAFTKEKTGVLEPVRTLWRPGPDSNRRPPP